MGTTRPHLKVGFFDFWPGFLPTDNYFYHVLSLRFSVAIDQASPDIAIFSVFGDQHRTVRAKKYHFTGETRSAPPETYDYSFTFASTTERNYRLPLWVLYLDWFGTPHPNACNPSYLIPLETLLERRAPVRPDLFCNFVYNNPSGDRLSFLDTLARRAEVECLGTLRNNRTHLGGDELTKIDALRRYRFTIAFENTVHPGYVTEKLLHPLAAQSVPIYWGCPEVTSDFNDTAFIDARTYGSFEALADAVMAVDDDAVTWSRMVSAPTFTPGALERVVPNAVANFFERTI